jgi:hypothetical protein
MKILFFSLMLATAMVTTANAGESKICWGLLTINWTEGVSDSSPHNNDSRLIRADNINSSCLSEKNSTAGKQILKVCKMGFACKVTVTLIDEPADVYLIDKVISVENITPELKDQLVKTDIVAALRKHYPDLQDDEVDIFDNGNHQYVVAFYTTKWHMSCRLMLNPIRFKNFHPVHA